MSRHLRALMRSAGAYAVHVADVFIALRDVVAVISQGIVSDEPANLDNYTAFLREKRLVLHSRIDEALDARDAADATLLALEKAVEDRFTFAHDPCASFLNPVLDWIYPVDNQNRDPLQFAAEAHTLQERINNIAALLEKMTMLVQGIPQRFSLDKVVEIRQLPDDERVRVVSGVRQADTKLELLDWRGRGLGRNLIQNADYIPLHA
ncbi:uncharacterized protein SCHCODRAFT_02641700 [Schizophyllum commune H4-8]|nr:uncharacterized protein SCHCODRAFT_02641700 [Schizophyllum commune H4-8]KAI5886417.1 hypothetical protein SCHCODRAFT_02641700 [Schizophyllum commune H4-8]